MLQKLCLAALLSLTQLPADVVYHLTDGLASLQYTAPDFITSEITVPGSSLDSCSDPYAAGSTCVSVIFAPFVGALGGEAEIAWTENVPGTGDVVAGYDYSQGTFSVTGTHTDTIGGGQLTITEVSSVPEPRRLWLLVPALLLMLPKRWRKV